MQIANQPGTREVMATTEEEEAVVASHGEEEAVEATVAEVEAMVGVEAEEVLPTPHLPILHPVCATVSERLTIA